MSVQHLAIRAPNWVGDLVMATPVFDAALHASRFDRVSIVLRKHLAPVFAEDMIEPHLHVIESDSAEINLYRRLRPDAVLLLTNSLGAAWRAYRAGIRVRAGTAASGRRFLLTHAAIPPTRDGRRLPIPSAHLHRDAAGLLGIDVPDLHPRLYYGQGVSSAVDELLTRVGMRGADYVLCCPGAAFGAAKLWPATHFAQLLDRLHARFGWRAVVSGGPGEEELIEDVARTCAHDAVSLASEKRDLASLKSLVARARLLVVGDSGPRWYAAAFDVPCVSVMGPNFPEVTATSLELAEIVRHEGLECAPCLQKTCPLGHHRCMTELSVDRVYAAALDVLERAATMSSA